ncbi:hypothetical protein KC19_4G039600 [Ceratodon purpureus]|uniref:Uncharacterized protein n=1 Tax=Ceratodon purpureus TaxID=3225 RepID=A0A8T0I6C3_CERPU|nr:hypothetical protein KC19_4G039600 [Ceratodon purpureus]
MLMSFCTSKLQLAGEGKGPKMSPTALDYCTGLSCTLTYSPVQYMHNFACVCESERGVGEHEVGGLFP